MGSKLACAAKCCLHCHIAFGFTAALLEGLPIIGLVFTVSNYVGAAMWAHGAWSLHSTMCFVPNMEPLQISKSVNIMLQAIAKRGMNEGLDNGSISSPTLINRG